MSKKGIFSEQGKKPRGRKARRAGRSSGASIASFAMPTVSADGGPMRAPTYRLPNGVVLQASEGITPGKGAICIAYCPQEVVIRRQ